jgi:hypothetical protein
MPSELSAMLRTGLEDALRQYPEPTHEQATEPALAGLRIRDLPGLMRDRSVPFSRQDDVLAAVVRSYRRSHHPIWAGALLDMLAPALGWVCGRIHHLPQSVEIDDLRQQVILQTLAAADRISLGDPPRWVRQRLVNRIRHAINQWLRRTHRSEGRCIPEVDGAAAFVDPWDDVDLTIELRQMVARLEQALGSASTRRGRSTRARRAGRPVDVRRAA